MVGARPCLLVSVLRTRRAVSLPWWVFFRVRPGSLLYHLHLHLAGCEYAFIASVAYVLQGLEQASGLAQSPL